MTPDKELGPIEISIRPMVESDSIEDLTALLHRSYTILADMGLKFMATHQDSDITHKRIEHGICFLAEHGGAVVGTITYYAQPNSHGAPWLERAEVAHCGQLAVEPTMQGKKIGTLLMKQCEHQARTDSATELALDTAETAGHLIAWYERLGYRFIEYADWDVTNYRSVIMSKKL